TLLSFFFFNDTATTEIYTLSLHDALPIAARIRRRSGHRRADRHRPEGPGRRSEEHTSELQSHHELVCRLLLEKKKTRTIRNGTRSRQRWRNPGLFAGLFAGLANDGGFFFNDSATTEIYTLSLHDALPI